MNIEYYDQIVITRCHSKAGNSLNHSLWFSQPIDPGYRVQIPWNINRFQYLQPGGEMS